MPTNLFCNAWARKSSSGRSKWWTHWTMAVQRTVIGALITPEVVPALNTRRMQVHWIIEKYRLQLKLPIINQSYGSSNFCPEHQRIVICYWQQHQQIPWNIHMPLLYLRENSQSVGQWWWRFNSKGTMKWVTTNCCLLISKHGAAAAAGGQIRSKWIYQSMAGLTWIETKSDLLAHHWNVPLARVTRQSAVSKKVARVTTPANDCLTDWLTDWQWELHYFADLCSCRALKRDLIFPIQPCHWVVSDRK